MTYELAKQLKDKGFPQDMSNGVWAWGDEAISTLPTVKPERAYVPTLSELIEACGDYIRGIHHKTDHCGSWCAEDKNRTCIAGNKTPEEAVAKLWLKLYGVDVTGIMMREGKIVNDFSVLDK